MIADGGALSDRDFRDLARMHVASMPDSMVSRVGERYAECFYRYLARSPHEAVFLERDEDGAGRVLGACMVSLRPHDLSRRLALHTPLLAHALRALPRLLGKGKRGDERVENATRQPEGPEVILMFVDPQRRSSGFGARMLARADAWFAQRGVTTFYLKTLADPSNRANALYLRSGYQLLGVLLSKGRKLNLYQKQIGIG